MEYRQLIASHAFRKQQLDNQMSVERFEFLKNQKIALKDFNLDLAKKRENLRLELDKEKEEWKNSKKIGQKTLGKNQLNKTHIRPPNDKSIQPKYKLFPRVEIEFNSTKNKSQNVKNNINHDRNHDLINRVQYLKKKVLNVTTKNDNNSHVERTVVSEKKSANDYKRKSTEQVFECSKNGKKIRKSVSNNEIIELIFGKDSEEMLEQENVII